MKVLAGTTRK